MAVNIKDDEATRLIRQLAALTGESMTAATRQAVRERLERLQAASATSRVEQLRAIGRDVAERLLACGETLDTSDLYGDDGLPR